MHVLYPCEGLEVTFASIFQHDDPKKLIFETKLYF